jgi:hypothetical protein
MRFLDFVHSLAFAVLFQVLLLLMNNAWKLVPFVLQSIFIAFLSW